MSKIMCKSEFYENRNSEKVAETIKNNFNVMIKFINIRSNESITGNVVYIDVISIFNCFEKGRFILDQVLSLFI